MARANLRVVRSFVPVCLVALTVVSLGVASGCGTSGQTTQTGFSPVPSDTGNGGEGGSGDGAAGQSIAGGGRGGATAGSPSHAGSGGAGSGGAAGSGGESAISGAGGESGGMSGGSGGMSGAGGDAGSGGVVDSKPPYPIVLCHGFFGFQDFAGIDFITYFYGVKDHLAGEGETNVFTPAVDPFNDSTIRGGELYVAVQQILAQTGATKVNLVGHSQGGLDARVVAHDHPEVVASVTTIATPHYGTPVADVALKIDANPNEQALVDDLVKLVGIPLYDAAGNMTSLSKSLIQMSTPEMKMFNATYTDTPGMYYQSIAGRSNLSLGLPNCAVSNEPSFLSDFNGTLDPVNTLLSIPGDICSGVQIPSAPNDGLIRVDDAKWGTFLGCLPGDHFDEIGQLFGESPGLGNNWAYLDFYTALVKQIRAKGFLSACFG